MTCICCRQICRRFFSFTPAPVFWNQTNNNKFKLKWKLRAKEMKKRKLPVDCLHQGPTRLWFVPFFHRENCNLIFTFAHTHTITYTLLRRSIYYSWMEFLFSIRFYFFSLFKCYHSRSKCMDSRFEYFQKDTLPNQSCQSNCIWTAIFLFLFFLFFPRSPFRSLTSFLRL